jgi:chlorobactene glucosyltransferase
LAPGEQELILGLVVLIILLLIALISAVNALTFPRLKPAPALDTPLVSILVPARNEADQIAQTLISLQEQSYPDFELILLDDGSSDGTLEIAQQTTQGDPRVQVISGQPLPPGWLGKNWACHQLSQQANGELLVFTDADVCWGNQALSAVVSLLQRTRADMLTVWPTQRTETWSERLIIPMMMFVVIGYLPEILVRYTPWPIFAAANGQCLAFRQAAYDQIDGHRGVRDNIIEDMGLAWAIKRAGLHLVMALGDRLIKTRMYKNWQEVIDGFAKNILAGHGGQPFFLVLSAIFHWLLFLFPWVWLLGGLLAPDSQGWPWLPGIGVLLALVIRGLIAATTRQRIWDALLLPVSVILMTIIALRALLWFFRPGSPQWKGRPLSLRS